MMDHGSLPVRLLDLIIIRSLLHAQDLVVVLALGLLQLQLGFLQQLSVLHVGLVRLEDALVVSDRLLVLLRLHVALGSPQQRLGVVGIQFQSLVTVADAV